MSQPLKNRSRGQAMVEFALVAPIFFLLLFAIIESGRFIFYYEMLNNATREGARYAIVHGANSSDPSGPGDYDKVIAATRDAAVGLVGSGDLNAYPPAWWECTATPPTPGGSEPQTNADRGQCVTVFLGYTYNTIIPIVPPITINAESTLVVNN